MRKSPQSLAKRQREQDKQRKRRLKDEKRAARKAAKQTDAGVSGESQEP